MTAFFVESNLSLVELYIDILIKFVQLNLLLWHTGW